MLKVLDIAGIHPDMRTSASVETCSLSIRQCQQTAIARMHCINSGHTNISVEFCLSLWNKFGLYKDQKFLNKDIIFLKKDKVFLNKDKIFLNKDQTFLTKVRTMVNIPEILSTYQNYISLYVLYIVYTKYTL